MKWSWLIAGVVGFALSAIPIFVLTTYLPGQALSHAMPAATDTGPTPEELIDGTLVAFARDVFAPERATPVLPIRLRIPTINVDALIEHVGLAPDGAAMDVPQSRGDAGWFEFGTRPGENGSAVIAGHYGRQNGKPSAFDDLHKLRPGDRVYIEDDAGKVTSFLVRRSRRYDPKADAAEVFSSQDGTSHLNLITCEGGWDAALNGYPSRLVVFADKEVE